ncbi:unnamed protein product [Sphagnum troendelagicum]|uniref:Uncharacterized protein n=1 Tax=Sphagnum troendelagicum TaxID=128251 RepID=A0ABP0UZG9_9BRYO
MCTEREVVRELSMTAALPSEMDVTMEKIPDNNRPLSRSRTPSRSMPSQALMRSSSSSPEVKSEAASKRRVPSPARPRERPVNPPAPAQEKALGGNRCSASPSPGPSKPPPLSSLKERTRLLPQVTASSPAPRSSSSDTKPRLSASTEQPKAATASLTSSLVSRPSSPSRTGPTTVIAKLRTSTPTRTISTKSPNPSSSSSSILTTRSAIAAKPSSSPAATTTSPNRPLTPTRSLTKATKSSMMHQSAPVNVPDWSKILGAHKKSVAWVDDTVEEGKDDAQEKMLPPHELLAREYAKSQATTFSVFEGAGRTLKGRDLSQVRTAVLRQTGFLDY